MLLGFVDDQGHRALFHIHFEQPRIVHSREGGLGPFFGMNFESSASLGFSLLHKPKRPIPH